MNFNPVQTGDYLRVLAEQIHSAVVATIGADGHPQTRVIDIMLWDDKGVYFLTAKGKTFYEQLMEQKYISLSATKNKYSVSLRGRVTNIGSEKLDEIFEKNPYMQQGCDSSESLSALRALCGNLPETSNREEVRRDESGRAENLFNSGAVKRK